MQPILTLASLSEPAFAELHTALATAPMRFRSAELAKAVSPTGSHLAKSDAEVIVEALREMAMIRATAEVELEEFVEDVIVGMVVRAGDKFGESEQGALRERLQRLLALQSVVAPAKARSLLIDYANYLCRARIFTDIRPVFGSDVGQTPDTALVVHTLKLSYQQGSSLTDFFVVLDRSDLELLSELIDRAKRKENSLHAMLGAAGLEPLSTD